MIYFVIQSTLTKSSVKMSLSTKLDEFHLSIKSNKWIGYFTIFVRIALAAGFIPSGLVKIFGERFTSLSNNHPMGHYLEALYHTGYYYTFIGVMQVTVALMLLIPQTAILGAVLYFPIIVNICVLSFSVRFDGSLISSPLMVLANLYLLCWYYDRLKFILPFNHKLIPKPVIVNHTFPLLFFSSVFMSMMALGLIIFNLYEIKPNNTLTDCRSQCKDSKNKQACLIFCDQIHQQGKPLNQCLDEYNQRIKQAKK